jgi:anti-sigma factor RsiW
LKRVAPSRIYPKTDEGEFLAAMFNCKDSIDLLLEYLDGEVTPEVKKHLEDHLQGCAPCEEFLKQYKETGSLCRKALRARMPREVADKLTSFLRASLRKA